MIDQIAVFSMDEQEPIVYADRVHEAHHLIVGHHLAQRQVGHEDLHRADVACEGLADLLGIAGPQHTVEDEIRV